MGNGDPMGIGHNDDAPVRKIKMQNLMALVIIIFFKKVKNLNE